MKRHESYACLGCGEDRELKLSITQIYNKDIQMEIECQNCLGKMFFDGKYYFVRYTNNLE